jgi:hypothetical protein
MVTTANLGRVNPPTDFRFASHGDEQLLNVKDGIVLTSDDKYLVGEFAHQPALFEFRVQMGLWKSLGLHI